MDDFGRVESPCADCTVFYYDIHHHHCTMNCSSRGAKMSRDITATAYQIMEVSDEKLVVFAKHDPSMFRDVAAAYIALKAAPLPARAAIAKAEGRS